jgi:hypothetical protein
MGASGSEDRTPSPDPSLHRPSCADTEFFSFLPKTPPKAGSTPAGDEGPWSPGLVDKLDIALFTSALEDPLTTGAVCYPEDHRSHPRTSPRTVCGIQQKVS